MADAAVHQLAKRVSRRPGALPMLEIRLPRLDFGIQAMYYSKYSFVTPIYYKGEYP
jgi:hypothetical protein